MKKLLIVVGLILLGAVLGEHCGGAVSQVLSAAKVEAINSLQEMVNSVGR